VSVARPMEKSIEFFAKDLVFVAGKQQENEVFLYLKNEISNSIKKNKGYWNHRRKPPDALNFC
jgi:hypothetical protein